ALLARPPHQLVGEVHGRFTELVDVAAALLAEEPVGVFVPGPAGHEAAARAQPPVVHGRPPSFDVPRAYRRQMTASRVGGDAGGSRPPGVTRPAPQAAHGALPLRLAVDVVGDVVEER